MPQPPPDAAPVPLQLRAADGRSLAALIDAPVGPPRASLVIIPAFGVPMRYYRHFAAWMARHQIAVLRVDLRGVGDSADRPLREDPATMEEWGRLDQTAALQAAAERWPEAPRWALGHSFGGQALGMSPAALGVAGALVVAAAVGDLRLFPTWDRWRYSLLLRGVVPAVVGALGYGPRWLQLGEPLPASALRQWARWAGTPEYLRGALPADSLYYDQITARMTFFELSDDRMVAPAAAARLRAWYPRATVRRRLVAPAELGLRHIGHFGFFRPGPTEALWAECRDEVLAAPA
ncbi:MAG: alpha/beta fold hydrolase [Deltaproteobacteria bacterium]|nr:alpha/beta fold hydrolase [Deltaproteobacteria bacterium]